VKIFKNIRTGRYSGLLVLFFFIVFSLLMTFPLILHMSDHIPDNLGDSYYNIWVMSWNKHALFSPEENLLDTNIYYPHKQTLYYADPLILESALNAFLMLGSKNPIFTYNLLFLFSFVLCGMGMYWLTHYLTGSRLAAVFAGLVFSYFPNKFAHLPHLEILFFGWMPLVFLFLHRFFKKPNFKNLLGFCLFYFLQSISCAYYAVFIALFVMFFVLYFAYKKGWLLKKDFWIKMSIAFLLLLVCLLPMFYPYIAVRQEMSFSRPLEDAKFYAAEPKDFLSVPPFNRVYRNLLGGTTQWEKRIFPGLVPVLLTSLWWLKKRRHKAKTTPKRRPFLLWDGFNVFFFVFISWLARNAGFELVIGGQKILSVHNIKNPLIFLGISLVLRIFLSRKALHSQINRIFKVSLRQRFGPKPISDEILSQNFYLFSAVMGALLAMGPTLTVFGQNIVEGPYYFLYFLFPGFDGLRVPPRFIVFVMLGLAVLSAWALAGFMRQEAPRARNLLIPFFMGVLLIVEYISIPFPLARAQKKEEIPPIYASVQKLPEKTVMLKFPMPRENQYIFDSETMYYSIYHWNRLVNGYSGYFPPGYRIIREAMEFFPSRETFALLGDLGVEYVLVHVGGNRPYISKFAMERIEKYPHQAELVDHIENDYLYRLIKIERADEVEKFLEPVDNTRLWNADTNRNPAMARLAFDGDLKTGWCSRWYQVDGDFFILDLGRIQAVTNLDLFLGQAPLDFPRGYSLEGSVDGQTWIHLAENPFCFPRLTPLNIQDFSKYRVGMSFEKAEVRFLKISLTKTFENNNWSIYEIVCR
jgi:hypothetical protein